MIRLGFLKNTAFFPRMLVHVGIFLAVTIVVVSVVLVFDGHKIADELANTANIMSLTVANTQHLIAGSTTPEPPSVPDHIRLGRGRIAGPHL